jgi:hypothetical protein
MNPDLTHTCVELILKEETIFKQFMKCVDPLQQTYGCIFRHLKFLNPLLTSIYLLSKVSSDILFYSERHRTPKKFAYHLKSSLLALKTIQSISENNLKQTIYLGNFEINTSQLKEKIEQFVQEKSLELLRPLKGYLQDGLEEARNWMNGLRLGFTDSSGKLSEYIKMK